MKRGYIVLFLFGIIFSTMAQEIQEEFDLVQEVYGMEKREIFEAFIGEDVNKEFWVIYKEYEVKRSELGQRRFTLIKNYSQDYLNLSDKKSSELLKSAFKLNNDFNTLITTYTRKIEKKYGGNIAMQFYQLEHYFLGLTRTELVENMPTIADMLKEE